MNFIQSVILEIKYFATKCPLVHVIISTNLSVKTFL